MATDFGNRDSSPLLTLPKYSRGEYERRFLVDAESRWRECVKPYSKQLKDRYLACGRLRLRRIEDSDTGQVTLKLTKKYESHLNSAQAVVSVGLSAGEYDALAGLAGFDLSKRRYYDEHEGIVFGVDVFAGELEGLILCETEAESSQTLASISIPEYAHAEVTEDRFFTGGELCRATRSQVTWALGEYRNKGR